MVGVAQAAFADWRRTSPYERASILSRAAALMSERRERLAEIIRQIPPKEILALREKMEELTGILFDKIA